MFAKVEHCELALEDLVIRSLFDGLFAELFAEVSSGELALEDSGVTLP